MKRLLIITLTVLSFAACTKPNWVQDLQDKNPLKDSADVISVYFHFDTIVNDYEVSGILYPFKDEKSGWSAYENGVRLFFHNLKTGKEYVWTDWEEESNTSKWLFMSRNVRDIVWNKKFKGFKNGDYYTFHYNAVPDTFDIADPDHPIIANLYSQAEYQFYDVDFDSKDELLIGYYHGGPYGCTCYEIHEITDSTLVEKRPVNCKNDYFSLDDHTSFDVENKELICDYYSGCCNWGRYVYKATDEGDLYLIYSVACEYDHEHETILSDTTYYQR